MSLGGLVSAEEGGAGSLASIDFYSKPGCELDFTDAESFVSNIQVYGEDKSDDELACFQNWWSDDNWPSNDAGQKDVWIDQSGIQKGCQLLLYDMKPPEPGMERGCVTRYETFGDSGSCVGKSLPKTFGYSYCCGSSCATAEVKELFPGKEAKRDLPSPPPVSELFNSGASDKKKSRDVADIKRRAPLERLERRDECKYENGLDDGKETKKPYLKYLKQYRVGPITKCNLKDGCEGDVTLSYSESISQTFTTEMSAGVTLLEVISLSMSMSYSETTAEENGYSYSYHYSVPQGASGYVAWEPVAECVKGKFTGDCDEWDSGVEGEACFLKMVNGIPDGTFTQVLDHA